MGLGDNLGGLIGQVNNATGLGKAADNAANGAAGLFGKLTGKDTSGAAPYTYDKENHVLNAHAKTKEGEIDVTVSEDGKQTTLRTNGNVIVAGADGSLSVTGPDGKTTSVKDPNMAKAIAKLGNESTTQTPEQEQKHEIPKLKLEAAEAMMHDASSVISKLPNAKPAGRSY